MPSHFEILASFAQFGREQRISLRDPKAAADYVAHVAKAIEEAVKSDTLLHGQRTQNMFEALVVSLGKYKLLKTEDAGRCHPKDQYRVPDFRVILNDRKQWLIEVKNIYDPDPLRQTTKFKPEYVKQLQDYADLMGCPLKLALYWARWSIWTLISPEDLSRDGDKLTIVMMDAVRANELAALGDRTIGTTPPLKFQFLANREKPRFINEANEAVMTGNGAKIFVGDNEVTDKVEQEIVWIFMRYGDWRMSGPTAVMSGKDVDALELTWAPKEESDQGFEFIGTLSSMFARYYATQTLNESGIAQIEADHVPNWFAPLVSNTTFSDALPLWRFDLQPNKTKK